MIQIHGDDLQPVSPYLLLSKSAAAVRPGIPPRRPIRVCTFAEMAKRTKKAGIVGKYGE